jgi:glycosyltransferase involved in cell wall biosynthesis
MSNLKILIFNWRDIKNPAAGGAEVFTHEVAKRLAQKGHEITLFTSEFPGCKKEETIDGVKIVRAGGKYTVYLKAREYYKERFSKEKFDIVIDEINTIPFFTPKFVNRGEKVFALIHQLAREYWLYETPFPVKYVGYYILEDRWLKNYVNMPTITVSNSTEADLKTLGFKQVYKVPEGLSFKPLDTIPEKEEEPTIIYLGRLTKAKRPDHAIKAFKIVKRQIPNAKLWIVGDGYLRKKLEKIDIEGVKFFGKVNEQEKIKLLSRAWILVNPSVREGFGLNVIEANACGTPAIAYNVPGLRDSIINGKTGLLVENGNIEKLANTIIKILEDEIYRKILCVNALEYAKNFSWDITAQGFEEFLKNRMFLEFDKTSTRNIKDNRARAEIYIHHE